MDDSILKKIKSVFIVEDPKAAEIQKSEPTSSKPNNTVPAPIQTARDQSTVSGNYDEKVAATLMTALSNANQEGFDYFEYRQTLLNLHEVNPDEAVRYKSAFAMAQTMGANKQKLLDSCNYYLNVLKQEENAFVEALNNRVNSEIKQKKESIQSYHTSIAEKEKMIAQLQKEIETMRTDQQSREQEILTYETKISDTHKAFQATYLQVTNHLLQDLENMKKYL